MATETICRVRRAPHGGYVALFAWNDQMCQVFFGDALGLASELVEACVDDATIEAVIDAFEQLQWTDPQWPLFEPPRGVETLPPMAWDYLAASAWVGAVALPWVCLAVGVRWLLGRWA